MPLPHSQARVVFGAGSTARLGEELDALGMTRVLLMTTPGRSQALAAIRQALGHRVVGMCDRAALHVPFDRVREAVAEVDRLSPDALVAVGGGSAIGLAKAVALERQLAIVAVPTTYSGSEMTGIWGITDGEQKRTGRDAAAAPRVVVYDPELTLTLPRDVSAASGMNAMAHAVEALYAADAGPIATSAGDKAIRLLAQALPRVVARPNDLDARTLALQGAHAAGVALSLASMGLHHKICHVLGGTFGLPHALTHAAVLPHVVAFNAPDAPLAMERIANALGAAEAASALAALNQTLGLHSTLADLGLRPSDVNRSAALIVSSSYPNPRPVNETNVRALLLGAL
ncbi:MAG TPA: maleylacetate reductase [Vicinamibacterales bacterium]|nr:maleylacetate reductase [Vicinamibacterales bacterium]